ncbi:MAG: hypothetical protein R3F46_01680 [bacterium]
MQIEGNREERGYFEEIGHQHLVSSWDFEELLAELRANPVLRGQHGNGPLIAKEYFAQA